MVANDTRLQGYNVIKRLIEEGVDIITSGFPCQDISVAGKKAGIQYDKATGSAATRSGLFGEVLQTIRMVRPRYWIMENVAAIFNGHLGTIWGEVAESGYDAQWDCLSSGRIGRRHLRQRFYAVAYPHSVGLSRGKQWMQEDQEQRNIHAALLPALPLCPTTPIHELPTPFVVGKDDGLPNRAHRIKSLGNSVDPQIVEEIGKQLNAI